MKPFSWHRNIPKNSILDVEILGVNTKKKIFLIVHFVMDNPTENAREDVIQNH